MDYDARWDYTWDGENRLIRMDGRVAGINPTRIDFEYDFRDRRIRKTVFDGGPERSDRKFLYDGWNVVAELDVNNAILSYSSELSNASAGRGPSSFCMMVRTQAFQRSRASSFSSGRTASARSYQLNASSSHS